MSIFSTALLCASSQWIRVKIPMFYRLCRFLHRSVVRHSVTCTIYPSSRVPSQQPTNPFGPKTDIPPYSPPDCIGIQTPTVGRPRTKARGRRREDPDFISDPNHIANATEEN